jgi:peptide/nickel transport system permease protein
MSPALKQLTHRVLTLGPVLLIVVFLVIALLELAPGDPAARFAGEMASPEDVARIKAALGLDDSLFQRYFEYLQGLFQGDLGRSLRSNAPVLDSILEALPVTASITLLAFVGSTLVALVIGTAAGLRPGGIVDRVLTVTSALAQSLPSFAAGLLLVVLFSVTLSMLPSSGYVPLTQDPSGWLRSIILPATALAMLPTAELARFVRTAVVDTMEKDYVRTATAKGLPRWKVVGKHVAKNAAIPVVTVSGMQLERFLGGTVIVETIFVLPGFGFLAVDATRAMDFPVIQGVVLVSGLLIISINLMVDLSYGYFDPRQRA